MVKARGWLAIPTLHKIRAVRIRSLTLPAPFQYHLQSMNVQTPDAGTHAGTSGSSTSPRSRRSLSGSSSVISADHSAPASTINAAQNDHRMMELECRNGPASVLNFTSSHGHVIRMRY